MNTGLLTPDTKFFVCQAYLLTLVKRRDIGERFIRTRCNCSQPLTTTDAWRSMLYYVLFLCYMIFIFGVC